MKQITSFPASSALDQFIYGLCPVDAHMNVQSVSVWADDNYDGRFTGLFVEQETTYVNVVRHFTVKGEHFYTLEKWEHDNGYRCELVVLNVNQYNHYVQMTGLFL